MAQIVLRGKDKINKLINEIKEMLHTSNRLWSRSN